MNYNFKQIRGIATAADMINITLSKTQRKTPTVIRANFEIGRIRGFYMRKVKYTQNTLHDRFTEILDDFPKLDDIHPFYADLINVLYDRDHYKLALGHISSARNIIDNIAKDYVRLMKYADNLYRCKMLKKAALGRMMTMIKKLKNSLEFLDEVRKHLGRLPSINPFERTLLVTGFPNVGKSSFVNQVTNANLDVQPYPFTTQSVFVGHTDYNYVRWQVLDTPGLLDHTLDKRNTIEMQAITALAHLKACVLYFIDPSTTCGYTIEEQINLFNSIKPLFKNKPLVVVFSKSDLKTFDQMEGEDRVGLENLLKQEDVSYVSLSNKSGEGIGEVKSKACDILLQYRLQQKSDQLAGGNSVIKNEEEFLRGPYVAQPKVRRDNKDRVAFIPDNYVEKEKRQKIVTLKEVQEQNGGAGVFSFPLQEHFRLEKDEWKYDFVPEIMDGKNIADFVDPDILKKLEELEKEEEMMDNILDNQDMMEDEIDQEYEDALDEVKGKRSILRMQHKMNRNKRSYNKIKREDELNREDMQEIVDNRKTIRKNRLEREQEQEMEIEDNTVGGRLQSKKRSISRSRSKGYKRELSVVEQKVEQNRQKSQKQVFKNIVNVNEADRLIQCKMPKHLNTGKASFKRDRR